MPRSLKIYIAGLVAVSAIALVVTSLVIPVDPRIGLALYSDNQQVDVVAGIVFWTVMTLLASALPSADAARFAYQYVDRHARRRDEL